MELVIPYTQALSLDEIGTICSSAGFTFVDGRDFHKPKEKLLVQPHSRMRVSGTPKREFREDGTGLDSPRYGTYRGRSFGWLTLAPTYLHVITTLGYWIRGYNWLMDNAAESSRALREYVKALDYHFPFLTTAVKMVRVDATYQLRLPDYDRIAPLLFAKLSQEAGVREDVYMHKSLNISGFRGSNSAWSCYNKHRQVLETENKDVPELRDVIRLTEVVKRGDKKRWGWLWEDEGTLEFSQEGLLHWLRERWAGVEVLNTSDVNFSETLKSGVKHKDLAAYLYFKEHPESLAACYTHLERRKFNQSCKRLIESIEPDLRKTNTSVKFVIPDASVFVRDDWEPVYYIN